MTFLNQINQLSFDYLSKSLTLKEYIINGKIILNNILDRILIIDSLILNNNEKIKNIENENPFHIFDPRKIIILTNNNLLKEELKILKEQYNIFNNKLNKMIDELL